MTTKFSWQIYVAGNNKTYLGLRENSPYFCPIFNKIRIFSTDFHEKPNNKFHGKPSSEICADIRGRTDGRTDTT